MITKSILCLALIGPSLGWAGASLQTFTVTQSSPGSLITSIGAQGATDVRYSTAVWPVTVDEVMLSKSPSSVVLDFPDRSSVTIQRMSFVQRGSAGFVWTGRGGDCTAFMRQAPTGFLAHLGCNNARYEISATPNGQSLQLIRAAEPASQEVQSDIVGAPLGPILMPQGQRRTLSPTQVDTSIDVLVLYTSAVRTAMDPGGGNAKTKQLAQDAIDETQTVLNYSTPGFGTTTSTPIAKVNLVSAQEVLYSETSPTQQYFTDNLTYLLQVQEAIDMRNFWAADVVMLLVTYGGTGISGLSREPDYQGLSAPDATDSSGNYLYAPYASSSLQFNCALEVVGSQGGSCVDYSVFAHEFAHNLGANHNISNSPWPSGPPYPTTPGSMPVEPYAFGHYGNTIGMNGGYRTIMSYIQGTSVCASPCTRVQYYSNSQVYTSDNWRTGVAGAQENAPVIAMFAPYTAQYHASLGRIFYDGFNGVQ